MRKTVVLVFGEMGAGKSYWGKKMSREWSMPFIEGDDYQPQDMLDRTENFKAPYKGHVDKLVDRLQTAVAEQCKVSASGVIVTQALYRNEHRERLIDYWISKGYNVECYMVVAGFWDNLRRLWSRPDGFKWVGYWITSKPWFQLPSHPTNFLFS